MKKTIIISILAILLIASFVVLQPNEVTITKEQHTNFFALKPLTTKPPISLYKRMDIIFTYNKWQGPDTLRIFVRPLANFYDENGTFQYCPPGNMLCESVGMECIGLEYKFKDRPWQFIDEIMYEQHPCEWRNMGVASDSTSTAMFIPYGRFYEGFDVRWNNWPIGSERGQMKYNFTPISATENDVTVSIYRRFEPSVPEIQTIPVGSYGNFTTHENIIFYIRGINVEEQSINMTVVYPTNMTYRAVCKQPGL
jgi:hypothetical protein